MREGPERTPAIPVLQSRRSERERLLLSDLERGGLIRSDVEFVSLHFEFNVQVNRDEKVRKNSVNENRHMLGNSST